jgi:hypothetical protein
MDTCFIWAAVYQNFSTILDDTYSENYRESGKWTDENNKPLLCELEDGVVGTIGYVFVVRNGRRLLELINGVMVRVVEGGIFKQIKKRNFDKHKIKSRINSPTSIDVYSAINISHLQTVFYILMVGYVLALVCFVIEVIWHRYRSKVCVALRTCLWHRQT